MSLSTPVRRLKLTMAIFLAGCGGGGAVISPTPPPIPPPQEVITITTASQVQCVQSVQFSMVLQATGNSSPVTWSITSGQLPTGLTLDSGSGTISGTPTAGSGVQVTVQAADAKTNASKQFSFVLYAKLAINSVVPANAHLNAAYSLTLTAQASSAIASWTVASGQPPPGLTFAVSQSNLSVATVSGSPTQTGSFSFVVQVQDYTLPQTATLSVTIVVDSHVAITKSSLKNGGQNQVYSDSFGAIDGKTPYHWSLTGVTPAGLTFNPATGQLSGTPTEFGGFSYTVTVTDSSSPAQMDTAQAIFNVAAQLQIFDSLIGPAFINQPYNNSFFATGGSYPYTWSLKSGNLPAGLSFFPEGIIQGTATQLGASNFTVQVTDSGSPPYIVSQAVTLNVTPTPLNIFGGPLSPAPINVLYHSQIPGSGGTPPYTWAVSSGRLPPGLTLNNGTGFIDGTPSKNGTFSFVIQGADSSNPVQTATANDFIVVRPSLGRNDSIATATPLGNSQNVQFPKPFSISPYIDPIAAPTANPDNDFYKLTAGGGSIVRVETFAQRSFGADPLDSVIELLDQSGHQLQACYQPSYIRACLNDDLDESTLDSALDLKVPGAAANVTTFFVHVLDWRGDARPDMLYYLNISGVIEPLVIAPATLGGATRGTNYQQQFTVSGGTGNASWSLDGGSLPTGWSLTSSGLLSGVATVDGSYTFAIKATDSSNPPQTARTQYATEIADPLVITSSATFPNACVNKPYTFRITTSGGIAPVFFGFSSGAWIAINLDQSTGTFSGIADGTGTFTGTLSATDSAQPSSGQIQQVTLSVVNCP